MFPIRTILHPTDFSSCSRYAFRLADALARDHGAGLIILHVKQTLGPMVAFGMALAELEPAEYQEKLWETLRLFEVPDPKVHVEHRLAKGDAAREILRAAKETGCDLIVMGSHGRTGLKRVILGSVAEQVLRKAPCPVVTVTAPQYSAPVARPATASSTPAEVTPRPGEVGSLRSNTMQPVQTILQPTDFSESCEHAFRLACSIARDQGARLIVLHVDRALEPVAKGAAPYQRGESKTKLWRDLHRFRATDPKVPVEYLLAEGDPATEILRLAEEVDSDLIVMGLHGRTGIEYLITGSVAEKVMRQAACPVLLVKIPVPCFPGRSAYCYDLEACTDETCPSGDRNDV